MTHLGYSPRRNPPLRSRSRTGLRLGSDWDPSAGPRRPRVGAVGGDGLRSTATTALRAGSGTRSPDDPPQRGLGLGRAWIRSLWPSLPRRRGPAARESGTEPGQQGSNNPRRADPQAGTQGKARPQAGASESLGHTARTQRGGSTRYPDNPDHHTERSRGWVDRLRGQDRPHPRSPGPQHRQNAPVVAPACPSAAGTFASQKLLQGDRANNRQF